MQIGNKHKHSSLGGPAMVHAVFDEGGSNPVATVCVWVRRRWSIPGRQVAHLDVYA